MEQSDSRAEESSTLDEAFERMSFSGFELPNGFVNHGPMACEALAALGCEDEIDSWARRFAQSAGNAVSPVVPNAFDWHEALGSFELLGEWIGFFGVEIAGDGWRSVVSDWVPRLVPALSVALFHGAIRTAHAVRAINGSDTDPRRAELARSLGYWAARFRVGEPVVFADTTGDVSHAVLDVATSAVRNYLSQPDILSLHGVTGAMALQILAPHIGESAQTGALAQLKAEHAALYRRTVAVPSAVQMPFSFTEVASTAAASRDPHQVKLVEACSRGFDATGDPAFCAAGLLVTGLG